MDEYYGRKYTVHESTTTIPEPPEKRFVKHSHVCQIKVKESIINPPIKRNGSKISAEWDFTEHDAYKWLIENCNDWRWDWAAGGCIDDNDEYMLAEIYFYSDEESATACKLMWS